MMGCIGPLGRSLSEHCLWVSNSRMTNSPVFSGAGISNSPSGLLFHILSSTVVSPGVP
jgi:hypothetical protein